MEKKANKTGLAFAGSLVAAIAASMCCILPLVAALLGLGGFAAAAFFERGRPYLLVGTAALLGLGFYFACRRPQERNCEPGSVCDQSPTGNWSRRMLWIVAMLVVALAAFPYYSGWVVQAVTRNKPEAPQANLAAAHVVLQVEGMDCQACAALIEKNLRQLAGVRQATVSYEKKQAVINYDPRAVDPSRFAKVITDAGFKVGSGAAIPLVGENR